MKRENLKYIILGIGIGFLLAAGFMLRYHSAAKTEITSQEIIQKAREMGMVFLTELPAAPKPDAKSEKSVNSGTEESEPNLRISEEKSEENGKTNADSLTNFTQKEDSEEVIREVIMHPDPAPKSEEEVIQIIRDTSF